VRGREEIIEKANLRIYCDILVLADIQVRHFRSRQLGGEGRGVGGISAGHTETEKEWEQLYKGTWLYPSAEELNTL